jgi:poly(3-hydroxybutyrate) depolymerase
MRASIALSVLAACAAQAAHATVPLPALNIDLAQTSVSGISSGGFMASQLHVAFSSTFKKGAGIVAAGPFNCSDGSVSYATGRCMSTPADIPVSTLVAQTQQWAGWGWIDPLSHLQSSKVYLFSGTLDSVVKSGVVDAARRYYQSVLPASNVSYVNNVAAEHAMVTDDYGSACATKASPYINDCNVDVAGNLLAHLYGALNARASGTLPAGNFVQFDQSAFVSGHGMATSGWAYVPQSCQAGATTPCRLHVALHGCLQNESDIGQQYVQSAGYNRWAETNRIVVLYPQTGSGATNSCWDWWGYDSYAFATRSGPQMKAIKAMVDKIASGGVPATASLAAPAAVATASPSATGIGVGWSAVSGAAGYHVYRNGVRVTTAPVTGTGYADSGLTAGTTYAWTVRAVNASGALGTASAPASGATVASNQAATCTTSSNYTHTVYARAYAFYGYTYATGSSDPMGLWNIYVTTKLRQMGPAHFAVAPNCPA